MSSAFGVACPSCHAFLAISSEAKSVLTYKLSKAPKPVTDLTEAARALQKDAERREGLFKKSVESEKTKADKLKKSFDDLLNRAKDEPLERPTRDMDLD